MLRFIPFVILAHLLIALGMYLSLYTDDEKTISDGRILFISSVILFMFSYALSLGNAPWVVNSEIFPLHLIDTAVALATATNQICDFTLSSVFLLCLEAEGGKVWTFLMLAFFATLALIFVYCMVPETAG